MSPADTILNPATARRFASAWSPGNSLFNVTMACGFRPDATISAMVLTGELPATFTARNLSVAVRFQGSIGNIVDVKKITRFCPCLEWSKGLSSIACRKSSHQQPLLSLADGGDSLATTTFRPKHCAYPAVARK
jgi:hypothetical protein